jgi:CubicO group peptidase (beta-lactamase class C family)/pimeloyl-ACP methyl ester carboxylesterase
MITVRRLQCGFPLPRRWIMKKCVQTVLPLLTAALLVVEAAPVGAQADDHTNPDSAAAPDQQAPAITERIVDVGGVPVQVWTGGPAPSAEGPPLIIFEHGGGGTAGTWASVAEEVVGFAPILAYNRPGRGRSGADGEPHGPEHVTRHLRDLLDVLDLSPPYILVGHSAGAHLIREHAILHPADVAGLVYVDPGSPCVMEGAFEAAGSGHLVSDFAELVGSPRGSLEPDPRDPPAHRGVGQERPPDVPVVLVVGLTDALPPQQLTWLIERGVDPDALLSGRKASKIPCLSSMALEVPRGMLIATPFSGHDVQRDEPELIVQAIRWILSHRARAMTLAIGATPAGAQHHPGSTHEPDSLLATIAELDERYFDAYNTCDLSTLGDLHARDLEAYHDIRGGPADWDAYMQGLAERLCGQPVRVRRELAPGTLQAHALAGFGALHMADHRFYQIDAEGVERPGGSGRMIAVWQNTEGDWKISRLISYDHVPPAWAVAAPPAEHTAVAAQELSERIDKVMRRHHELGRFHGSILVARDGEIVYEKGYGLANREWEIANTPDTRFHIASITKMFTATLALQQVERGRIRLDAPITTYLPEYPANPGERITVHHLLSHSSGIPDFVNDHWEEYKARYLHTRQPADTVLADMARQPLEFEPGEGSDYNNTGFVLLGMILERVTGIDFCTLLRRQVLEPAGMASTGCDAFESIIPRRAAGYRRGGDEFRHLPYDHSVHADGMMYSTVQDLFRFDRAMAGGILLSSEMQSLMNTSHAANGTDDLARAGIEEIYYGYGIMVRHNTRLVVPGHPLTVLTHGGRGEGFSSMLVRIPEDGVFVAALNNLHQTNSFYPEIFSILYGAPYELPQPGEGQRR